MVVQPTVECGTSSPLLVMQKIIFEECLQKLFIENVDPTQLWSVHLNMLEQFPFCRQLAAHGACMGEEVLQLSRVGSME